MYSRHLGNEEEQKQDAFTRHQVVKMGYRYPKPKESILDSESKQTHYKNDGNKTGVFNWLWGI